jgi:hypothetical protein
MGIPAAHGDSDPDNSVSGRVYGLRLARLRRAESRLRSMGFAGFSEALWNHYQAFKQTVIGLTPSHLSLRDKDRLLIGRSTRKSIEKLLQGLRKATSPWPDRTKPGLLKAKVAEGSG